MVYYVHNLVTNTFIKVQEGSQIDFLLEFFYFFNKIDTDIY